MSSWATGIPGRMVRYNFTYTSKVSHFVHYRVRINCNHEFFCIKICFTTYLSFQRRAQVSFSIIHFKKRLNFTVASSFIYHELNSRHTDVKASSKKIQSWLRNCILFVSCVLQWWLMTSGRLEVRYISVHAS